MPRLLIVHHTPSPGTQAMFEAVVAGATDPEIEGVDVIRRPALTASATDVLKADGYLLGTPAIIGYMSGANARKQGRAKTGQPRPYKDRAVFTDRAIDVVPQPGTRPKPGH